MSSTEVKATEESDMYFDKLNMLHKNYTRKVKS